MGKDETRHSLPDPHCGLTIGKSCILAALGREKILQRCEVWDLNIGYRDAREESLSTRLVGRCQDQKGAGLGLKVAGIDAPFAGRVLFGETLSRSCFNIKRSGWF